MAENVAYWCVCARVRARYLLDVDYWMSIFTQKVNNTQHRK